MYIINHRTESPDKWSVNDAVLVRVMNASCLDGATKLQPKTHYQEIILILLSSIFQKAGKTAMLNRSIRHTHFIVSQYFFRMIRFKSAHAKYLTIRQRIRDLDDIHL